RRRASSSIGAAALPLEYFERLELFGGAAAGVERSMHDRAEHARLVRRKPAGACRLKLRGRWLDTPSKLSKSRRSWLFRPSSRGSAAATTGGCSGTAPRRARRRAPRNRR